MTESFSIDKLDLQRYASQPNYKLTSDDITLI